MSTETPDEELFTRLREDAEAAGDERVVKICDAVLQSEDSKEATSS